MTSLQEKLRPLRLKRSEIARQAYLNTYVKQGPSKKAYDYFAENVHTPTKSNPAENVHTPTKPKPSNKSAKSHSADHAKSSSLTGAKPSGADMPDDSSRRSGSTHKPTNNTSSKE